MFFPATTLTIRRISPTQVRVTWSPNTGRLQSAPTVFGPWNEVPGATSGSPLTIQPAKEFFRVAQ